MTNGIRDYGALAKVGMLHYGKAEFRQMKHAAWAELVESMRAEQVAYQCWIDDDYEAAQLADHFDTVHWNNFIDWVYLKPGLRSYLLACYDRWASSNEFPEVSYRVKQRGTQRRTPLY